MPPSQQEPESRESPAEIRSARLRQLIEWLGQQRSYARGWKREVADQLGVHPTTISRWLSGSRTVDRAGIYKIGDALSLDTTWFYSDGSKPPSEFMRSVRWRPPSKRAPPSKLSDRARQKALARVVFNEIADQSEPFGRIRALADMVLDDPATQCARMVREAGEKDPSDPILLPLGMQLAMFLLLDLPLEPPAEPAPDDSEPE